MQITAALIRTHITVKRTTFDRASDWTIHLAVGLPACSKAASSNSLASSIQPISNPPHITPITSTVKSGRRIDTRTSIVCAVCMLGVNLVLSDTYRDLLYLKLRKFADCSIRLLPYSSVSGPLDRARSLPPLLPSNRTRTPITTILASRSTRPGRRSRP